ncbi:MAG: hypothetical protein R3E01_14165 [Pirellulaceae bacterium]|nr:hypothetical protein [Caldilineaceae bacterium]
MLPRIVAYCLLLVVTSGCLTPSATVTKNPGPKHRGVRYYRPKPYLFVRPARLEGTDKGSPAEQFVEIGVQYLPDYSEEYAIHVRPGLGLADVDIKLENGWNLTAIGAKLDSQTDEQIDAIASLASSFQPTKSSGASSENLSLVVAATNVPLGFYEAVVGCGPQGQRHLQGWRYVGFAPFNNCPTVIHGGDDVCCNDPAAAVYGLVFENGVMVFRQLDQILGSAGSNWQRLEDPDNTNKSAAAPTPTTSVVDAQLERLPDADRRVFRPEEVLQSMQTAIVENRQLQQWLGEFQTRVALSDEGDHIVVAIRGPQVDSESRDQARTALLTNAYLRSQARQLGDMPYVVRFDD